MLRPAGYLAAELPCGSGNSWDPDHWLCAVIGCRRCERSQGSSAAGPGRANPTDASKTGMSLVKAKATQRCGLAMTEI